MADEGQCRIPSVDELMAIIERRQKVHFWGRDYFITPRVLPTPLGDGQRLIYFTPLNTRPNHYVVMVDSTWCPHFSADAVDTVADHCDEISEALEDYFGPAHLDDDDTKSQPFPYFDDSVGVCWSSCDLKIERREAAQAARRKRKLVADAQPPVEKGSDACR